MAMGVGVGGKAELAEALASPVRLPVLRRSRSQSRPQQVKFCDDLPEGVSAYSEASAAGNRQAPLSERPSRRVFRLDEADRRSVQLHPQHSQHHRRKRHNRRTRSDNALHLPPPDRIPSRRHYGHQGPTSAIAMSASSGHLLPDPKPRLHGNLGPQRQLSHPHATSEYALQHASRSSHFRHLYDDGDYDDYDDDDWCSTCSSSSSDSDEEEGFFLGQPIPRPRTSQRTHYYADDLPTPVTALSSTHPYDLRTKAKKRGHRGKNCIIS